MTALVSTLIEDIPFFAWTVTVATVTVTVKVTATVTVTVFLCIPTLILLDIMKLFF